MRKLNFRERIKSVFCGAVMVALLFVSVFSILLTNRQNSQEEKASASVFAVDTDDVLDSLGQEEMVLEASFDLKDKYFLFSENQNLLSSNLCWAFAGFKAVESAFLVQENEFYNFSESAMAYFGVTSGELVGLASPGTFGKFSNIMTTNGIVHESEFSNEKYFDMTDDNLEIYSYVEDLASNSLSERVASVSFEKYSNLNKMFSEATNNKAIVDLVKKYIKTYGGLFVGVDPGMLYLKDVWQYANETKEGFEKIDIGLGHAVCLVGWDDNYGFLALNSWGTEVAEFYIPYSYRQMYKNMYNREPGTSDSGLYNKLYSNLFGFVVDVENKRTDIVETSASEFSTSVLENEQKTENIFCYGEDISLTFKVANNIEFTEMYAKVFKGTEDVTDRFVLIYEDVSKTLEISSNNVTEENIGGNYVVKFFIQDRLMDSKSFFVFTGTEIQYFSMIKQDTTDDNSDGITDSVLMVSSFLTSDHSQTFYIDGANDYKLYFNMLDINRRSNTGNSLRFQVVNPVVLSLVGGTVVEEEYSLSLLKVEGVAADRNNRYAVKLPALGQYKGKVLNFKVQVFSNQTEYSEYIQTFNINIVVSSLTNITSSKAYAVEYVLDGGRNSALNVERYPDFADEAEVKSMTPFKLYAPTKSNSQFIGWFTDAEGINEVTEISGVSGDIVLYAIWEKADIQYFTGSFAITEIRDNQNGIKDLANGVTYGDSVKLTYNLTILANLERYNYTAAYYYYINGKIVGTSSLQKGSQKIPFEIKNQNLNAGTYTVELTIVIVISHNTSISETKEVVFEVAKREAVFEYENKSVVYNGELHAPIIALKEGSLLARDQRTFEFNISETAKSSVGKYEFKVLNISNSNYFFDNTKKCELQITEKILTLVWSSKTLKYNGSAQDPQYQLIGLCGNDIAEVEVVSDEIKTVGQYVVSVNKDSINNPNYKLEKDYQDEIVVVPAKLTVKLQDVKDKVTTGVAYRKKPVYELSGDLFDPKESLNIEIVCEGLSADKSGTYEISGTYDNPNYEITFEKGKYVLLGDYKVYYTLPNGEVYIEEVEAGEDPKGVPEEEYKVSALKKLIYSEELKNKNQDLYIVVSEKSYAWIVWAVAGVVAFVSIYLIATRKQRRNKVS